MVPANWLIGPKLHHKEKSIAFPCSVFQMQSEEEDLICIITFTDNYKKLASILEPLITLEWRRLFVRVWCKNLRLLQLSRIRDLWQESSSINCSSVSVDSPFCKIVSRRIATMTNSSIFSTLLITFLIILVIVIACIYLKITCVQEQDVYMFRRTRIFWRDYNRSIRTKRWKKYLKHWP